MAAVPWRMDVLETVINSLLPQVDRLNVYLNSWEITPDYLTHPKINAVRFQEEVGDLGDTGKFFWCKKVKGIHLTVDDDIMYPDDYVETILSGIRRNKKCIVTFHGSVLISKKFLEKKLLSHFAHHTAEDIPVSVGGTGVMAYCSKDVAFSLDAFQSNFWADGWVAIQAKKEKIPIIALKHDEGWLKPLPTTGPDIWTMNKQEERREQINNWIVKHGLVEN